MDLSTLSVTNDSVEMELRNPETNLPLENDTGGIMTVSVVGMDSDKLRKFDRDLTNKRLKGFSYTNTKKFFITAEEQEEDKINRIATCIVGWKNLFINGQDFPYSTVNSVALMRDFPFIREQVEEFVGDRTNFFVKASKT